MNPLIGQVTRERGANLAVDLSMTLATNPALNVTDAVLALINQNNTPFNVVAPPPAAAAGRPAAGSAAAGGAAAAEPAASAGPLMADPASAASAPLDVRRVMAALPHRFPMLLVDRVEELVIDRADRRHQGGDDQRAFFRRPFPGPADHARAC